MVFLRGTRATLKYLIDERCYKCKRYVHMEQFAKFATDKCEKTSLNARMLGVPRRYHLLIIFEIN